MTAIFLRRKKLGKGSTARMQRASTTGITTVRNWVPSDIPDNVSMVIRWGCTSSVSVTNVLNRADAIYWCSDKMRGRMDMQEAGVPVPRSYFKLNELADVYHKVVLRPSTHSRGRNVHVFDVSDVEQVRSMVSLAEQYGNWYASDLIAKVAEYRVCVAQNRVVWVAQKTPGNPEDVAWNVAQGGRFDNVRWGDWDYKVVNAALRAAKVSGTDFCGVDVMVDADGNPYVLEVNSAPSMTSEYRATCLAKVFDHIVLNGKEHFPDPERSGWKGHVHPALWRPANER